MVYFKTGGKGINILKLQIRPKSAFRVIRTICRYVYPLISWCLVSMKLHSIKVYTHTHKKKKKNISIYIYIWASQVALVVKNSPSNAGDMRDTALIPESGRSPGEGMATHSSILAWRIP